MLAAGFIFAAIFAVSASAQGTAQPAAGYKIVIVNTAAFDSKEGITKYVNALTALETEMRPLTVEIEGMVTRYNALGADIKKIQDQMAKGGGVPIDQAAAQKKVEDYKALEIAIKRKQEDGKQRMESRQPAILNPVLQDIAKAMDEFAKQKGYALILDISKDNTGLILAVDAAKLDVTKEFITYYNARPATAATASVPK